MSAGKNVVPVIQLQVDIFYKEKKISVFTAASGFGKGQPAVAAVCCRLAAAAVADTSKHSAEAASRAPAACENFATAAGTAAAPVEASADAHAVAASDGLAAASVTAAAADVPPSPSAAADSAAAAAAEAAATST